MNEIKNTSYLYLDELPLFIRGEMFNENELKDVIKYCDTLDLQIGSTLDTDARKARKSKISFFGRNNENEMIFERINNVIHLVNEQAYQMNLFGYHQIQYTVYNEGHKYDYHVDTVFGSKESVEQFGTRKLSFTILLNDDFEGGKFELYGGSDVTLDIKKGQFISFPSYLVHRITPITKGTRKSLVVWVTGPKFK